jgi:hypothetical protein
VKEDVARGNVECSDKAQVKSATTSLGFTTLVGLFEVQATEQSRGIVEKDRRPRRVTVKMWSIHALEYEQRPEYAGSSQCGSDGEDKRREDWTLQAVPVAAAVAVGKQAVKSTGAARRIG